LRYDNDCHLVRVRSIEKGVKAVQNQHAKAEAQKDSKRYVNQSVSQGWLGIGEQVTVNHDESPGV
jgi:hypothetical protein